MSMLIMGGMISPVAAADPIPIVVEAGPYTRIDTPVSLPLEKVPAKFNLVETSGSQARPVPAQIETGNPPRLWFVLTGTTPAGKKRNYELREEKTTADFPLVQVEKDAKVVLIRAGREKILQYNHAPVPPPPGAKKIYTRSAFIHPLWSPSQKVLTNIHPRDHYHHVGLWMPWTHTRYDGRPIDFWNLAAGQGTVRFTSFLSTASGPVFGGFQAEQHHIALQTPDGEKVILKEVWDVRAYSAGGVEQGFRIVDFTSMQTCVAEKPLFLPRYRYGGFGFRANGEWKGEKAAYLTSTGKNRKDSHRTRARWCDTSGQCGTEWVGVTHMSHPQNFRHPESMRIWPGFNQEVFFNWSPIQMGDWVMEPGKTYTFRYRMYLHEGKVKAETAERAWRDFGDPPQVYVFDKKVSM